ncbi:family 16 glycoside hydrolase [candidate division KSB1 bacterium]
MKSQRNYNKITITVLAILMLVITVPVMSQELPADYHPAIDAYDGWRLGTQAYTFNRFTFFEAIDKTASLGLDWIEAYPGQRLNSENRRVSFDHNIAAELRENVKAKLKDAGIRIINYGVVGLPNDEAECRKVFDFAKDMGIETIVSEPPAEAFEMIDKLCQEYRIKVAIHNHPSPSPYWDPEKVLEVTKGRSSWIGSCADTGHWMRSGVDPLEAIKKLEGRIVSVHLKDLNEFGSGDAHDVVWGTGKADLKAILAELDRQKFKGVFSIEYEYSWENNLPEIRPSVAYFNEVSGALNPSGWKDMLAPDLSNCTFREGSWTYEEGVLARMGRGNIYTNEDYGDYILDLEYMVSENANSGVLLRVGDRRNYVQTSIEVQIHETTDGGLYGSNGSIYNCLGPSQITGKKANEWNHYTITCKDNQIYIVLNNVQIIDMDLNKWIEPRQNPDGTRNKFRTALKDFARTGAIGLQDHGAPLWFRNIKIRELK